MYNDTNSYFLGYCVIPADTLDVAQTKYYKMLWNAYVDDIRASRPHGSLSGLVNSARFSDDYDEEFFNTILYNEKQKAEEDGKLFVLVVPDEKHFGWTAEKQIARFDKVLKDMHIIILSAPELSTYTIDNKELVALNDTEKRENLIKKFNTTVQKAIIEKNPIIMSYEFRKIFWKFQNYTINVTEALSALKISKPTFLKFIREYMTSEDTKQMYNEEFQALLPDFERKPPRGVVLDEDTMAIFKACMRRMGDDWDFQLVAVIANALNLPLTFIPKDYFRFRHHYLTGRSQQYICAEKYKGNKEINNMIDEYFQEKSLF